MPLYHFNLRNGGGDVLDEHGTELPNVEAARAYAGALARELMFRNEHSKRHWWFIVSDADGRELFELPFIACDDSLRQLNPDSRQLIEQMCIKRLALAQAVFDCKMTVLRTRAIIARSRSRPYVVSNNGHAVFRQVKQPA